MANKPICADCKQEFDLDEGGFLWQGLVFCEDCDPEEDKPCKHPKVECPNHKGSFDCNPFCQACEGEQEFCPCNVLFYGGVEVQFHTEINKEVRSLIKDIEEGLK
jgi:hypothetical protein